MTTWTRSPRRRRVAVAVVLPAMASGVLVPAARADPRSGRGTVVQETPGATGSYFGARFQVRDNSYAFGQAPTFDARGDVLSEANDPEGVRQVYRSRIDGSHMNCLTCRKLPGPNGFAAERPGGGWILFASYGEQPLHYGGPGLGGYGGDLYVMREDGSDPTRLTAATDPAGGAPFDATGGVPYDNYHPYWSPDGRHLAWVRTEAYPLSEGGQRWEIMVADFAAPNGAAPHLANVRVVGPAFGVYETQQWAPDGSGFLFTAFGPRRSPFQASPPGWMHQELYFMRIYGTGVSPDHPRVTEISDDLPVYEEQAAFTPDMRDVVFMTNRNATDGSWYDAVIAGAQRTGFDAPDAGSVGTPQFLADFSDPHFRSDLYMIDLATRAVRPLTHFGGDVIPEFSWNRGGTTLIWSAAVVGTGRFRTQLGTFSGSGITPGLRPSRGSAPALVGASIDMGRVAGELPPPVTAGPSPSPTTGGATTRAAPTQPATGLPPVVASYAALWLQQLGELGALTAGTISRPPLG